MIRLARAEDLPALIPIYAAARRFMPSTETPPSGATATPCQRTWRRT